MQTCPGPNHIQNSGFRMPLICLASIRIEEVKAFAESKKFTMPFAPDPHRRVFSLYATQNIPRNVITGSDGKIIFQSTGYNEQEFKELETLFSHKSK